MKDILKRIEKNLYKIENILSTPQIKELLNEKRLNSKSFLDTIKLYIDKFDELSLVSNSIALETLDENLSYFLNHSHNKSQIYTYHIELAISINYIESKIEYFFKNSNIDINNINIKEDINLPIKSIEIKDFYSIYDLKMDNLDNKKEIYIVGENGDGKTLLLQSIAIGLKGVEEGDVFNLTKSQSQFQSNIILNNSNKFNSKIQEYKNLFAYGSNRNNSCKMEIDKSGYLTLFNDSLDLKNPIEWLIGIYNAQKDGQNLKIPLNKAINIIQKLLDRNILIEVTYNNVSFKERGTTVEFKQLSAGYRSVIITICDLLDRLSQNQLDIKYISDFKGVVLIDEIELHLHPKWKYSFVSTLREFFPNIQFIITTHSPTVLLGASKEAVFYKIYKDDGEVKISEQIKNEGYSNNTIISSPLFDLGTMKSKHYSNKELSEDDYVYSKIHKVISQRLKEDIDISEEELLSLIDKQLDEELEKL